MRATALSFTRSTTVTLPSAWSRKPTDADPGEKGRPMLAEKQHDAADAQRGGYEVGAKILGTIHVGGGIVPRFEGRSKAERLEAQRGVVQAKIRRARNTASRGRMQQTTKRESAGILARTKFPRSEQDTKRGERLCAHRQWLGFFAGLLAVPVLAQEPASKPIFKLQEVMIPVRMA